MLIPTADEPDDGGSQNLVRASAPSVTLRRLRVMIVDDHEEFRAYLTGLVRDFGHEVLAAADGSSALSLVEAFRPECAIVDLSMPTMNGMELGRRLRERFAPAQLYLIALSGYADAGIRDACLAESFDAYLIKAAVIPELGRLLGGGAEIEN